MPCASSYAQESRPGGWSATRASSTAPASPQVIGVLKEAEAGAKTKDLGRKYGISDATFYIRKAKCGGMTVSDVRRLRELEQENARLKKLLAEAEFDKAALEDLLAKRCGSTRGTPLIAILVRLVVRYYC